MRAENILDLARSQIGITEYPPDSNNVKYNTEYYGKIVSGNAYPWCCVFIWWLFYNAGAPELFYGGKKTASCTTLMKYYRAAGQLVSEPQPGDIVFYQFDKDAYADHAGIIESVSGSTIIAIEGNTSGAGSQTSGGAVLRKTRSKSLIMAVARPAYEEDPPSKDGEGVDDDEMTKYNTLEEVPAWGRDTVKKVVDKGYLRGTGKGLDISEDMLRILVITDRAGIYD